MVQGTLTSLTVDRFGNANSALSLNGGYAKVPAGYFFTTAPFTISAWVYANQVGNYARVIDFGNGKYKENVLLSISYQDLNQTYFAMEQDTNNHYRAKSVSMFAQNMWTLLTLTYDGFNSIIYFNGIKMGVD